jgi:hypothetical protein
MEYDKNELNVIPRSKFVGLLLDLPLGISEVEVREILENDLHFDNYGNVDYTAILNGDLFCALERQRLKAIHKKKKVSHATAATGSTQGGRQAAAEVEKVDNRKVVVEDLIYVDDLEILIYTTIAPKTSSVFVTSVKKSQPASSKTPDVQVVTLGDVGQAVAGPEDEETKAEKQSAKK